MIRKNDNAQIEASSFRDPSGMVFTRNGRLYRQINPCYREQYCKLMDGGLYAELTKAGMLIGHQVSTEEGITNDAFLVIEPTNIPFISYPYEWAFGMLKDAALLTLSCHKKALAHGMILKDASAYNVQFLHGQPVLIDTLSFDIYQEGMPWIAYGQFCRHFIAPLLMMCNLDLQMSKLLRLYIDGIPLPLASKLLHGKGGFFAKQHIHWHAKAIMGHAEDGKSVSRTKQIYLSKNNHIAMIDSIIRGIESLRLRKEKTEWSDYYAHTNYSQVASDAKEAIVRAYIKKIAPKMVWDLGANDGVYTKLASTDGMMAVAFDIDPLATERNYSLVKSENVNILPLIIDLTNPSPAIGFANCERKSIAERGKPDCILALAIIHHLAISNNLPLPKIAEWLSSLADNLIIEFVPKEDSKVQVLLATRDDIFPNYSETGFENAFCKFFEIADKQLVSDSKRLLYRMKKL